MSTACFTGRRPKDLQSYELRYNRDAYVPVVEYTKQVCRVIHEKYDVCNFISGGAQGFDQLAFWAVNSLKKQGLTVKNIVYVPFKGQENAWQGTGLFSPKQYRLMLSLADEVVYCAETPTSFTKSVITPLLHGRNHKMVDVSNYVVGLFPDSSWYQAKRGGTAECLNYAYENGKVIFQIQYEGYLQNLNTVSYQKR